MESLRKNKPWQVGGIGNQNEFGKQYRQGNRVYNGCGVSPTLTAQPLGNMGGTQLYS